MTASGLVAYVLTLDEAHNMDEVLASLRAVTDTVVVVDSGSSDGTPDLARSGGAEVWERAFDGFASQRNWALDEIERTYRPAWILQLDADERISPELAHEIPLALTSTTTDVFLIPLRIRFCGRVLLHGGFARSRLPRLYRAGAGRYEDRAVNEHVAPTASARLGHLTHAIVHEDVYSWERHIEKHNHYSTLEAQQRLRRAGGAPAVSFRQAVRHRNLRRRWLRERVWDHLPARPLLRFLQIYAFSGGFLDGRAGFRIALFHAWQEMCTDAKAEELAGARPPVTSASDTRAGATSDGVVPPIDRA
jgi:hypothetical protein